MKYDYNFATGTETVEIDEKWARELEELDRQEYNNWHKENRRSESLSDEGEWAAVEDSEIESFINGETEEERLHKAINMLKPAQKEIIIAIYFQGLTQTEYAEKLGVSQQAISQRLITAEKNLKKFFEKTL